jgi:hypothetical protein
LRSIFGEGSDRADESYDQEELMLLELINQYRWSKGLPTLSSGALSRWFSKPQYEDIGRIHIREGEKISYRVKALTKERERRLISSSRASRTRSESTSPPS